MADGSRGWAAYRFPEGQIDIGPFTSRWPPWHQITSRGWEWEGLIQPHTVVSPLIKNFK